MNEFKYIYIFILEAKKSIKTEIQWKWITHKEKKGFSFID